MDQITLLGVRLAGVQAHPVRVCVKVIEGPWDIEITGLATPQAREMRLRVQSALQQSGYQPQRRYSVEIKSTDGAQPEGAPLDLAVALGVLACANNCDVFEPHMRLIWGELTLHGNVREVRGDLAFRRLAMRHGLVPLTSDPANGRDTLTDAVVAAAKGSPTGLVDTLSGEALPAYDPPRKVLLVGAPGTGKTTVARALRFELPQPTDVEVADLTLIANAAGMRAPHDNVGHRRPFRAPHHSVSEVALLGGGSPVRPGEVTLAHGGTLFLDEVCEFRRAALDGLGRVLTTGVSVVARTNERVYLPARPLLVVAAMMPCPCGWHGDNRRECRCTEAQVAAWNARVPAWLRDKDTQVVRLPVDPVEAMVGL